MHFAEAVPAFEIQLQANQRSCHTVKSYRRDIGMLRGWLEREDHPLSVDRITPPLLLQFAASPACTHQADGTPRKPGSIDKIKMSVRAFFGFLNDAGLIPTNPARILKYRRGRERVPETLTADECRRLLQTASQRDAMILDLFLHTGIRLEALVGLDVDDVRLPEGRVVVRHQKGGNEVTKAIPVALLPRLKDYLRRRIELDTDSHALFLSSRKLRLSGRQVQQMVEKRGHEAGISKRVTPHMLRRTFATRLYERSKDLLLVQRALDHRFVGTTQRYARTSDPAGAAGYVGDAIFGDAKNS